MNRNALAVLCAMLVLLLSTVTPMTELEYSGTRLLGQEEENDQSVTLVRPVGGESYNASESVDILFSNAGLTEVLIELKLDRESGWSTLGTRAMEPDTSSWWVWEVPNHPTTTAQVRVSSASDYSISDTGEYFTIMGDVVEPPENVTVISPNGGESYFVDDTVTIEWNGGGEDVVHLYYAVSRGPWVLIEEGVENTGSYDWVVPDATSDEAQIKVCVGGEAVAEDICDFNDDFFEILPRPPCTPLGRWSNNTVYDTRDTVLYPPPLAIAWVSLMDNNTDVPEESGNGHDSWVTCNYRPSVIRVPVVVGRWAGPLQDGYDDPTHARLMQGTTVMTDVATTDARDVGGHLLVESSGIYSFNGTIIIGGFSMEFGNVCADITLGDDDVCFEQRVVTGGDSLDHSLGGCWTDSDGSATWKDDCGEGDVSGVLSVSEHPPIVTGACDDGALAEVGVLISDSMYDSMDVNGHLLVESSGAAQAPQCGAVVTIIDAAGEDIDTLGRSEGCDDESTCEFCECRLLYCDGNNPVTCGMEPFDDDGEGGSYVAPWYEYEIGNLSYIAANFVGLTCDAIDIEGVMCDDAVIVEAHAEHDCGEEGHWGCPICITTGIDEGEPPEGGEGGGLTESIPGFSALIAMGALFSAVMIRRRRQ